jgi:hypothetical protein
MRRSSDVRLGLKKRRFVMAITSSGEDLRYGGGGENSAMKAIAVSVLAFAIIAASVITYQAAAKPRVTVSQAESCIGLNCLPPSPPIKHGPAHRATLPPIW